MKRHSDRDHLAHIADRIRQIDASRVATRSPGALITSPGLADATLRRLQTMCESTQKLPQELKEANPDIPWRDMAGFRNHLAHGYLDINLDVVWDATRDLDPLRRVVTRELGREHDHRPGRDDDLGLGR